MVVFYYIFFSFVISEQRNQELNRWFKEANSSTLLIEPRHARKTHIIIETLRTERSRHNVLPILTRR